MIIYSMLKRTVSAVAGAGIAAFVVLATTADADANGSNGLADSLSWKRNLRFRGTNGFWGDQEWYDLQMERRIPETTLVLQELIYALPPLQDGEIADIGAGTGRSALAMLSAYPRVQLTLLDADAKRGKVALERLRDAHARHNSHNELSSERHRFIQWQANLDYFVLPPPAGERKTLTSKYDAVVAVQAIRHIVAPPAHYADKNASRPPPETEADIDEGYALVLRGIYASLKPGGHFLMGDHTHPSHPGVFRHLELLKEAGFTDVDVAWAYREWFVVGARRPLE